MKRLLEKMNKEAMDILAGEVIDKVTENIEKVVRKDENRAEKKFDEHQKKMVSKNPDNVHLWMQEKYQTSGMVFHKEWSDYLFYDIDGNLKYIAKGGEYDKLERILLYNAENRKIAEIYEKLVTFRNPLSLKKDIHPVDFDIIIDGKKLGKLCTVASWGKQRLVVKFNGWKIEIKPLGIDRIVDIDGNVVAEITSKLFGLGMMSFLDFQKNNNEILIVILAVAIRAYSKSFN